MWFSLDTDSVLLLLSMAALIGMSAYFSASETAMSSVSRIRMKSLAEDGSKKAEKVLRLAENFDKTLSGLLIGNNVVNIASTSIGTYLATMWWGAGGVGISTVIMTVLVLTFGEILPKSFAKENAEDFALATVNILSAIVRVLTPIAAVFSGIKGIISRPDDDKKPSITEEELKYIIEEIQDEGVLEEQESELAQSALEFDEIKVSEVLTPRVDIVAIDVNTDVAEIQKTVLREHFTRIPVYEDNIDNIIGILHEREFLAAMLSGKKFSVRDIINDVMFIPDNLKISKTLSQMQKNKMQMAVVVDQYGGTAGIVTMEDILEELVGEIWDEHDEVLQLIQPVSPNVYKVNGNMDIDDMVDEIGYEGKEIESMYNSVGGWATEVLGKIPAAGDSFVYDDLKVTVSEVDDNRVAELIVEYIAK